MCGGFRTIIRRVRENRGKGGKYNNYMSNALKECEEWLTIKELTLV
jgi:hypothetical protein